MSTKTRAGLLDVSISLLLKHLSLEYGKYTGTDLPVKLVRNIADLRSFKAQTGNQKPSEEGPVAGEREKNDVLYPRASMAIGSLRLDESRGIGKNQLSNGQMIGKDVDKGVAYFESYRPVVLTLGLTLTTHSMEDVITFATMLFEMAPSFTLLARADTGFLTEIGVGVEAEMTIPQADMSQPGDPFVYETTFAVRTYSGVATQQRIIRRIEVDYQLWDKPSQKFNVDLPAQVVTDDFNYYDLFDRSSAYYKYDYSQREQQ